MSLIPGLRVSPAGVERDQTLPPSGILGVVGLVERPPPGGLLALSDAAHAHALLGPGTAWSLPALAEAVRAGARRVVVSAVEDAGAPAAARLWSGALEGPRVQARAPGPWANGLSVEVQPQGEEFLLCVRRDATALETLGPLSPWPDHPAFFGRWLELRATTLRWAGAPVEALDLAPARPGPAPVVRDGAWAVTATLGPGVERLRVQAGPQGWVLSVSPVGGAPAIGHGAGPAELVAALRGVPGLELRTEGLPTAGALLSGGLDPPLPAWQQALDRLEDAPEVDLVLVCSPQEPAAAIRLNAALSAHCERMSAACQGRLGLSAPPEGLSPEAQIELCGAQPSPRLVLVTPPQALAAVAGLMCTLRPQDAPTQLPLPALPALPELPWAALEGLLRGGLCPVARTRGLSPRVVRGQTTTGEAIGALRVVDRATRAVRAIGERFVGRLNDAAGRAALRAKVAEQLVAMEREGALVPGPGREPAFSVALDSSPDEFTQGVVRLSVALRPVSAMDQVHVSIQVLA